MKQLFCARDPRFRAPVGALPVGNNLHLRIRLPRSFGCSAASFCIRRDDEHSTANYSMFWCGMDGNDYEWWECDYTPANVGIYWYCFHLNTLGGLRTLCRSWGSVGSFESTDHFQLTVYDSSFKTPDWLAGGVIYQIFPDRFARSDTPKSNVPGDRRFHLSRWETPDWQPGFSGDIENDDYFGGDLPGITEKLDYLQKLGITCIYLNPIFEAHANHRYNTADYEKIDPLLGTEADLRKLCNEAALRGIHVLLDGVFNHTGSDSRYFNANERYHELGAAQSKNSPYADWFDFTDWPTHYASWWGFRTLPAIRHNSESFRRYITAEGGISDRWMQCGVRGWRLDVVDELSDELLDALRIAVKRADPNGLLLGEVWEDASNKISYEHRRRYLLGKQLDSVMNYPFRTAILHYINRQNAALLTETVETVLEHYPPQVIRLLMNPLGTHDTERILTALSGEPANGRSRYWQAQQVLNAEQRRIGLCKLRLATAVQYCLPGVPSVYYGDEAGLAGYTDPFNRGCFPWGHEDTALIDWFCRLGQLRRRVSCLVNGTFVVQAADGALLAFERANAVDRLLCICNASAHARPYTLPSDWQGAVDELTETAVNDCSLTLSPYQSIILVQHAN